MKEIKNIVLYTTTDNNGKEVTKSCIFYSDGTVLRGTKEDAIKAISVVAKERNIISKDELRSMINKEVIYKMTEAELTEKYDSFMPKKEVKIEVKEEPVVIESKIPGFVEAFSPRIEEPEEDEEEVVLFEDEYESEEEQKWNKPVTLSEDVDEKYITTHRSDEYEEKDDKKLIKLAAGIVAIGIGIMGISWLASRCSRKSVVGTINGTTTSITSTMDETTTSNTQETTKTTEETKQVVYNNDLYNDYNYAQLLNVTKNDFQKTAMINLGSSLTGFNSTFANNYLESGHDIKAALSFDEMVALQQAYNSYSIADVRAYFNGYEVDAIDMSDDYKSASLQLMGAHIIESKEHPVDMSNLINSQEGKDFYNKYHKVFLAAKEATGVEQLRLVNELYKMVREDFPVTSKVRTEGISHSEKHKSIKDYQLAVAPMIAASEMLFQNLKTNYTLNSMEVSFINDIGLCNHADDKFERIETIMLGAYEDNENPLYIQYRNAIITELTKGNKYVIDDAHRELSNLRRFQEIVNGDALYKYRNAEEKARQNGENRKNKTTKRTYTKTTTKTRTETKTRNGGPIPSKEKEKIDKDIDNTNKKAKEEAEKKAKEEAQRQQEEENKKKKAIEESIAKENEKKKKEAENKAKEDKSVKNVSPSSGPKQTLPDPNEYGKNFDDRVKVKTK